MASNRIRLYVVAATGLLLAGCQSVDRTPERQRAYFIGSPQDRVVVVEEPAAPVIHVVDRGRETRVRQARPSPRVVSEREVVVTRNTGRVLGSRTVVAGSAVVVGDGSRSVVLDARDGDDVLQVGSDGSVFATDGRDRLVIGSNGSLQATDGRGDSVRIGSNGSLRVRNRDGSRVRIGSNGSVQVRDRNGSSVRIGSNGSVRIRGLR